MKNLKLGLLLLASAGLLAACGGRQVSSQPTTSSEASSQADSSEETEESEESEETEETEETEESGTEEGVTYTITGNPNWVANDGAAVFAWAWNGEGDGDGHWYAAVCGDQGTGGTDALELTITFQAPADRIGVCLARCVTGTEAPDWQVSGDNPGRVYNQTEDIAISGEGSYVATGWKEYAGPSAN